MSHGTGFGCVSALLVASWAAIPPSLAATLTVREDGTGQYPTIQAAVDAAANGDMILIGPGIYTGVGNRDVDPKGKLVVLRGEAGAAQTIIDCQQMGRGFYIHSGETSACRIAEVTIRNGKHVDGGAIYCFRSSPTFDRCVITNNTCDGAGGGIYLEDGGGPVTSCHFEHNVAGYGGGGLYTVGQRTRVSSSVFLQNKATFRGGGIAAPAADLTLAGCVLEGNYCDGSGGGVYLASVGQVSNSIFRANHAAAGGAVYADYSNGSSLLITQSVFERNQAGSGGAVRCLTDLTVSNCLLRKNRATSDGGGIAVSVRGFIMQGSVLWENSAGQDGGGVACYSAGAYLQHCTLLENTAAQMGGAVYRKTGSLCSVENAILWNNVAGAGSQLALDGLPGYPVHATVLHSDLQGGASGVFLSEQASITWDAGNLDVDPEFAFPHDPHLLGSSPCVDAGTNSPTGGLAGPDLDGTIRPVDGDGDGSAIADMGAFERKHSQPCLTISEVSLFATSSEGSSPPPQTLGIRNAGGGTLAWFISEDTPWLTVEPSSGSSAGEAQDVVLTVDASALSHGSHSCVLRVEAPGAAASPRYVHVRVDVTATIHVPAQFPTVQSAVDVAVDGDVILLAPGVYRGPGNRDVGYLGKHITIRGEAGAQGTIVDCEKRGIGFVFGGNSGSGSVLEGVTIQNGYSAGSGGAVRCGAGSTPVIRNCILRNNGTEGGGAIHSYGSPRIENCLINSNRCKGVYCQLGHAMLVNCTLADNESATPGGGLEVVGGSTAATLVNCTLWRNLAPNNSQIHLENNLGCTIRYCDIQGGEAGISRGSSHTLTWGDGNLDEDPIFQATGNYRSSGSSPCVDGGTNAPPGALPIADLDGTPRPLDGDGDDLAVADIGAYELGSTSPIIGCSPATLDEVLAALGGESPASQSLVLSNGGTGALNWQATTSVAWLTVSPSSGNLAPGDTQALIVGFDTGNLTHGRHVSDLRISGPDAANSPTVVPAALRLTRTVRVPSEFATIQSAIDAVEDYDTVLVAPGTYTGPGNREIDLRGKTIAVRSEGGAAVTTIDCENVTMGFYLPSMQDPGTTIQGFTITRGHGGGIRVGAQRGSPTIRDCVITNNSALQDAPLGPPRRGGGVYGACTLINCRINGNKADEYAVYTEGDAVLLNCAISGNEGGGLCIGYSRTGTLTNCRITNNAPGLRWNQIEIDGGSAVLTNCTIYGTLCPNVQLQGGATATITNCIIRGHPGGFFPSVSVSWSNLQSPNAGIGNISADPKFIDPDGPDDDPSTWQDNDFRLSPDSPSVDAGDNTSIPAGITTDLAGHPRRADSPMTADTGAPGDDAPIVDMGAYEFIAGDLDDTGAVDQADLDRFLACALGPGLIQTEPNCRPADMDSDRDVDQTDFGWLQVLLGQ